MNTYQQIEAEIQNANNIVITSHKLADGDSVGCSLGLLHFIEKLGKKAVICHPDPAPKFLYWLDSSPIVLLSETPEKVEAEMKNADLIFCLDYNATNRLGPEMKEILEAAPCKKIMIDHHLNPEEFPTLMISETTASSTS